MAVTISGDVTTTLANLYINTLQTISTAGTTLIASNKGHLVLTTGTITVPASVFVAGDVVSLYNDSASSISIVQGASLTLRQAGTVNTGNRTLLARGLATLVFITATEAVVSGPGVS